MFLTALDLARFLAQSSSTERLAGGARLGAGAFGFLLSNAAMISSL
jgi:hypothetical protein